MCSTCAASVSLCATKGWEARVAVNQCALRLRCQSSMSTLPPCLQCARSSSCRCRCSPSFGAAHLFASVSLPLWVFSFFDVLPCGEAPTRTWKSRYVSIPLNAYSSSRGCCRMLHCRCNYRDARALLPSCEANRTPPLARSAHVPPSLRPRMRSR